MIIVPRGCTIGDGRETSMLYLNFTREFQTESGRESKCLMSGTRKEKLIKFQTTAVHNT